MRILHFSDLHIGIENYGRPATEQDLAALPEYFAPGESRDRYLGYSTRLIDFLCAFDELIHHALSESVDAVVFSGDAYKNREPTQTHQREFAKRIARLSSSGVPIFLLVGNHDLPHATYKATAIEIFDTLGIPRVTIGDRLAVYRVETKSGPLQVLALPWIRRGTFLARDEIRNLPYAQINEIVEARLTAGLQERARELDLSIPAVLSAHVSVNTAKLGTERTMMVGYDHVLLQSSLVSLPVDYVALGHIHRPQKLADAPPMAYPGSLQRVDFGEEEHDAKGFWVVDLDAQRPLGSRVADLRFHEVKARAFVTIAVNVAEGETDPTAKVVQAIARHYVGGAIVRVHVTLPASLEPSFREREVREALNSYNPHVVVGVMRTVERGQRTRLGGVHAETKSAQEMLDMYLGAKAVNPDRARKLASYAERLIQSRHSAASGVQQEPEEGKPF